MEPVNQEVAARVASATSYAAATVSAAGGWTANDVAAYGGLVVAIVFGLIGVWFRWDRRRFDRRVMSKDRRRANCAVCPYREDQAP